MNLVTRFIGFILAWLKSFIPIRVDSFGQVLDILHNKEINKIRLFPIRTEGLIEKIFPGEFRRYGCVYTVSGPGYHLKIVENIDNQMTEAPLLSVVHQQDAMDKNYLNVRNRLHELRELFPDKEISIVTTHRTSNWSDPNATTFPNL